MNFGAFRDEFFRYYGDQKYMAAFKLAEKFVPSSSGEETTVTNWKLCAASLAGKPNLVLSVFRKAVDSGFFFSASALRGDPDLAAMQDNPKYQRLVAICEQRHSHAQENTKPVLFTTLPETHPSGPYPLLMAFHGWGQPIDDFLPRWNTLAKQGWLVALPQSSQLFGNGINVWDNFELSLQEVAEHYQALCAQYPIDRQRVVVAGFSQGGGLAVWTAVSQTIPALGFIGVGPYLEPIDEISVNARVEAVPGLRGYLVTGGQEQDAGMFGKLETLLNTREIPFQRENHAEIGHEFPPDFDQTVQRAIGFIFEKKRSNHVRIHTTQSL